MGIVVLDGSYKQFVYLVDITFPFLEYSLNAYSFLKRSTIA